MATISSTSGVVNCKSVNCGLQRHAPARCMLPGISQQKKLKFNRHVNNRRNLQTRAEYSDGKGRGGGDFVTGFLLGGAVFGALGYLFAPQISKALSGDEDRSRKKIPKLRMDDDEGLEKTRKTLNEKIAQLNAAIDDVSAQLRADDGSSEPIPAVSNVEQERIVD